MTEHLELQCSVVARDLTIINRRAQRLNTEAQDVLSFQGDW